MYGEGISKTGELVDLGVKAGIVEKSGAWFSFDSERIGQGRENAKAYLKEHPETAIRIERAIRQNAGLLAGQILEGGSEPAAEEGAGGFAEGEGAVTPLAGGAARRGRRGA
jgi:recombination protein RecA